jgi:hypothetical protein
MNFRKRSSLLLAALLATCSSHTMASDWYTMLLGQQDAMYFFDAASLEKSGGVVRIWVKSYQASRPGSGNDPWAMAVRSEFHCASRTWRELASSSYDKEGRFIETFPGFESVKKIEPDTIVEKVFEMVCQPDFPTNPGVMRYQRTAQNAPTSVATRVLELLDLQRDPAPK